MELEGKVAIVTGAAMGIGRACALQLAKEGADIVLADIELQEANRVADEIKVIGRRALAIKTDVTKSTEVNQMVKKALEAFGKIDILVSNAGQGARERASLFCDSSEEVRDFVITLNFKGMLNCCRAVINHMIERRTGKIVSISSRLGVIGGKGLADYTSAKAAIIGFSKALAKEVAPHNVYVNTVAPGPIETRDMDFQTPQQIEMLKKGSGLGRYGKPEDIAYMVAFLVSDKANFITGQNFIVAGPPTY